MWMWIPLVMLLMCLSGYTADIQQQITHERSRAEAVITGDWMLVYMNAVQRYARAHPDVRGHIEESELALPAWFLKNWNMGHALASGQTYIYYTAPPPRLIGYLLKSTDHSIRIGINQHGLLVSPHALNKLAFSRHRCQKAVP